MEQPLLDVRHLRTVFMTDAGLVRAVDDVSFDLRPGERLDVVGESGSGKSATAKSIMGLIEPPGAVIGGEAWFKGRDLLAMDEEELSQIRGRDIAIIFQDPMTALDPVFTIGDQMVETLRTHRDLTRRQAREVAAQALADVHIPNPSRRLDDYPHQFSGGMRQRVVIAMALMCSPSLIIADEPTTALDVTTQAQVMDLMLGLADERGAAVMLIAHDLGVVAGFCETVQVMYAGKLVERSPVDDLYRRPGHPYTRGLLDSVSHLGAGGDRRLRSIPGAPPPLLHPPRGCRFHPRCDYAVDLCRELEPEPLSLGGERLVSCHFAKDLAPTLEDAR